MLLHRMTALVCNGNNLPQQKFFITSVTRTLCHLVKCQVCKSVTYIHLPNLAPTPQLAVTLLVLILHVGQMAPRTFPECNIPKRKNPETT